MPERSDLPPSDVETTGHEWDGIKEYNNPLPRWWLWTFYVTIIWSIGYWIVMPAWPLLSSYTEGLFGYTNRKAVMAEISQAQAAQGKYLERIRTASLEEIRADRDLLEFALAGGRSAFAVNCSQCHGSGGAGFKGYPNLNDDHWLWGGTLKDIQATITHGIRSELDDKTRQSEMPRFLADGILKAAQVNDVAEYVLSLTNRATDKPAADRGRKIFAEQCVVCHGTGGEGKTELGAPRLNDPIWLYGGDKETIVATVSNSRRGVMPAWGGILAPETIKKLTVYVHSLGGGK
jgi:cytochrome c oxidase cbb3-type subunit 3